MTGCQVTEGGVGLAQAIVNTVREPLLVLDSNLRVVVASRSYCQTFQTTPEDTQGRLLYELGAGEWNIPALRSSLERIVPEHGVQNGFEVEQSFSQIGRRTMLLNARKVFYEGDFEYSPFYLRSRTSPNGARRSEPSRACWSRRTFSCGRWGTASPIASRSSPASFF